MSLKIQVLLLDDDENHLGFLAQLIERSGYTVQQCLDVPAATAALSGEIHFAIVDLFLAGDDGDELSNKFVEDELMTREIAFGRMSSAPGLVPRTHAGRWVYDKRKFRQDPEEFMEFFIEEITELFPGAAGTLE